MPGTRLTPEKITSPIQLMAAWFAMLILLVSVLLAAAIKISTPEWAAGYIVIFTSIVIVLVLGCVTLMLTVFRPHLQEGKEYAQWLRDKNTYTAGLVVREQPRPVRRPRGGQVKIDFADGNGNVPIHVNGAAPGASQLTEALHRAKLQADAHREFYDHGNEFDILEQHESIWVGYRAPVNQAVRAIKIAVAEWPHLKYVHLSNDGGSPPDEVHSELYIGGASSTAAEYGLLPWSADDFDSLSESMTSKAFHHAIRDKYS